MPLVGLGLIISLLCLNVIPFLTGVYSKEMLITTGLTSLVSGDYFNLLFGGGLIAGSALTITYSVRIHRGLVSTKFYAKTYHFLEKPAVRPEIYAQDSNKALRIPFITIILACTMGGSIISYCVIYPSDSSIAPWWIIFSRFAILLGGFLGALFPCRNVTKARLNVNVKDCRRKKICQNRHRVSRKPRGYPYSNANWLIRSSVGRE